MHTYIIKSRLLLFFAFQGPSAALAHSFPALFHPPPPLPSSCYQMPSDLYFVVRTVQLLRGIAHAFDLDYSLADRWAPYAKRAVLLETGKGKR